jgi:hypothetical protein
MAHTTEPQYDQFRRSMIERALGMPVNKSAGGPHDPHWDAILAAHAAAASGDPAGQAQWAAIAAHDPGVARLVPEVVKAHAPAVRKSRKQRKADEFSEFMESLRRTGVAPRF